MSTQVAGVNSEEMFEEIGVAKIDYEKRADEVLYGIEIQQSTVTDKIRDAQISTYEFEPVPVQSLPTY